jgi:hypothetical protein
MSQEYSMIVHQSFFILHLHDTLFILHLHDIREEDENTLC